MSEQLQCPLNSLTLCVTAVPQAMLQLVHKHARNGCPITDACAEVHAVYQECVCSLALIMPGMDKARSHQQSHALIS